MDHVIFVRVLIVINWLVFEVPRLVATRVVNITTQGVRNLLIAFLSFYIFQFSSLCFIVIHDSQLSRLITNNS